MQHLGRKGRHRSYRHSVSDWDGTELETEVVEPSAEELTYTEEVENDGRVATMVTRTRSWSATGTRDVYQGVDQTKLIPILTKALQEALARIEELESNTLQPAISNSLLICLMHQSITVRPLTFTVKVRSTSPTPATGSSCRTLDHHTAEVALQLLHS